MLTCIFDALFINLLQNCCIKTSLVKCLIYPYSLSNFTKPSLWPHGLVLPKQVR